MEIFLCAEKKTKMFYVDGNVNNIYTYVLINFKLERMGVVFKGKVYSIVQLVFIFKFNVIIRK